MPKLEKHQIEQIVSTLKSGKELPPNYKQLLFPPSDQPEITPPIDQLMGSILVVDDNENNRELLRDHLEFQGHTIETAENGKEALEMMRNHVYDLVLLDIMMPVMDGYEVLEHLRGDTKLRHIPVIVISAISDIDSVVRCVELGAHDYLFKPFDVVLLRARIGASLEKKRLRDQEQLYLQMLEVEQEKSEQLLLNVLPQPIANRLKEDSSTIADNYSSASVLFADIVNFTSISADISPTGLVDMLNSVFSTFDTLADKHQLEKIKTIGDSYMVVGGLPEPREDHLEAIANMALDMREFIIDYRNTSNKPFSLRIGINTGPVVAGVIGTRKFSYDLWGDTVNVASRMEESGVPDKIQVTSAAYELLKDSHTMQERGLVQIKGKGDMLTYFLESPK